ncbi:MAG: hypothetical protein AB8B80_11285 [Marinicellaceae bacterium]
MIHIITVHWKTSDWIDLQLKYIKHFINEPYKTYAFLNHIPQTPIQRKKFFYVSNEDIQSHAIKLNLLADMACFESNNDDDLLMFIDGDAFPVGDISQFKNKYLKNYPLAAVQRLDNNGDIQPHPCFCMTTVKFWKKIKGDWKPGNVQWKNASNENTSDVGGLLLSKLNKRNIDWYKLNRSTSLSSHPVFFGIYDNLIYHHGAGFRIPGNREDISNIKNYEKKLALFEKAKKVLPISIARKLFFPQRKLIKKNHSNSENIFNTIKKDFYFFDKL